MPKTTTTKTPAAEPDTDKSEQPTAEPQATELTPEEQAAWNRCVELQAKIDALEQSPENARAKVALSLLNLFDPQTRTDLRAVRVAIEEAIPSSRYLSGNDVEGCKRIKDAIDKILELPEPPTETEE